MWRTCRLATTNFACASEEWGAEPKKACLVVTSYNLAHFIERCLRSCLSQNFPSEQYEVIVVGDASTDGSPMVVEKYQRHPNFRLIVNPKNGGVAEVANIGIRASRVSSRCG